MPISALQRRDSFPRYRIVIYSTGLPRYVGVCESRSALEPICPIFLGSIGAPLVVDGLGSRRGLGLGEGWGWGLG